MFNTAINARTVQHSVQHGIAGELPKKCGPNGGNQILDFKILLMTYESCVRIKQINAETDKNTHCRHAKHINNTIHIVTTMDWLLWKLKENRNVKFKAGQTKLLEQRQLC